MKIIRNIQLILLILFLGMTGLVSAQRIKAELIGGFNKSQVDGDETAGFRKYGFNAGPGVVVPIKGNWSLSLETLYSQEGSRLGKQINDSLDGSYKLRMNYARVPFMLQYTDKEQVSGGLGLSYGRLVFVDEYKNGYRVDSVTLLDGPFDLNDWQFFADIKIRVYRNLKFNMRYSYSIDKIATREVIDSMSGKPNFRDFYHNLWSFRLIWMLNEAPPDKQKKRVAQ